MQDRSRRYRTCISILKTFCMSFSEDFSDARTRLSIAKESRRKPQTNRPAFYMRPTYKLRSTLSRLNFRSRTLPCAASESSSSCSCSAASPNIETAFADGDSVAMVPIELVEDPLPRMTEFKLGFISSFAPGNSSNVYRATATA